MLAFYYFYENFETMEMRRKIDRLFRKSDNGLGEEEAPGIDSNVNIPFPRGRAGRKEREKKMVWEWERERERRAGERERGRGEAERGRGREGERAGRSEEIGSARLLGRGLRNAANDEEGPVLDSAEAVAAREPEPNRLVDAAGVGSATALPPTLPPPVTRCPVLRPSVALLINIGV